MYYEQTPSFSGIVLHTFLIICPHIRNQNQTQITIVCMILCPQVSIIAVWCLLLRLNTSILLAFILFILNVGGWVGGLHHPNPLLQVIAVCFDWAEYWVGRGVSDVRIFQVGTLQRPRPPPISRDRRGIASPLLVYSLLPLHDKWSPSGWLISLVQVQSIRLGERSIRSLWCTHRNSKCCCFTVWMAFYYGFLHRDTGPRGCLCLQSLQDRDGRWCNPQPMKSWLPCPRGRRRRPDNQPGKETMCMWALCSNTSRYLAKHPIQLFLKRWVDYFTAGLLIHNVERHERYL